MEEELAKLTAEVAALKAGNGVGNTVAAETYYYLTIPLMLLIHVGFLGYEMGASRMKNVLASGIKNILANIRRNHVELYQLQISTVNI